MDSLPISALPTEAVNLRTGDLSRLSTEDALYLMNDEDALVAPAVRLVVPEIARAVDAIAEHLSRGGRMFYVGAGTSGRLGVVDASECPPTFGVSPELVQGIIAGGPAAVFRSQEGAEDDEAAGAAELESRQLGSRDVVVGLAASGRTPYVLGAIRYAGAVGALTGAVTVNPGSPLRDICHFFIAPEVGAEVIAGSTRLKSGTAQKLVLNMISTGVMVRLGYVDGNRMTHLRPSCGKLVARAQRLVMDMAGVGPDEAAAALEKHEGEVWRAVGSLRGLSP